MFRLKLKLKKKRRKEKEKSIPIVVTKYLTTIASILRQTSQVHYYNAKPEDNL